MLWTAASRVVRAPSRFDRDPFVPGIPPFLLAGGPNVRSEVAKVFEIGYRGQPATSISYSITAFHSIYDDLRTQEIAASRRSFFFANGMEGTTSGVEMWGTYQASRSWRLSGGFTALKEILRLKPGSNDQTAVDAQEGRDPAHSWMLRSSLDLPHQSELDVILRRVAALSNPTVPAYSTVDLRYGWKPRRDIEVSITGQNLLGGGHGEFTSISTRTEHQRAVFLKLLSHF
jgi:iron complex outermembrane receptor protein